jgi:hypothetical protein
MVLSGIKISGDRVRAAKPARIARESADVARGSQHFGDSCGGAACSVGFDG